MTQQLSLGSDSNTESLKEVYFSGNEGRVTALTQETVTLIEFLSFSPILPIKKHVKGILW